MFVTALLAASLAAPVPKEKAAPLYYPTKAGTRWVMECGDRKREYAVVESAEKDGEWAVTVEVDHGDRKEKREQVVSAGGVFTKLPSGRRVQFLEAPPKTGAKWTAEEHFSNGRLDVAVVCEVFAEERVKVPAGAFDAVAVEVRVEQGGRVTSKTTQWYTPGHGVVKSVSGGKEEWVMTSFEKGK